jgi:hypothetical protein
MLLSARSVLKRVSIRFGPPKQAATAHWSGLTEENPSGDAVSPALALASEQISARPAEFATARKQANGE